MMPDADFANPTQESIWKVTRQLKKDQCSIYNCVASVLSDAAFVSDVRALYPSLPLLANLRCGLWYTRHADGTCYFKSTDGHNGNWSFSCTRLNWHVCEMAAKHGGVIIVDATRKGKRFPDAMTKTIPIWTAVVNRAVARKRAEDAQRLAAALAEGAKNTVREQQQQREEVEPDPTSEDEQSPSAASSPCSPVGRPAGHRDGGCGFSCAAQSQGASGPGAGCRAGPADTEGCARVGSLSQWLPSPLAMAEWEGVRSGTLRAGSPCSQPQQPHVPVQLGCSAAAAVKGTGQPQPGLDRSCMDSRRSMEQQPQLPVTVCESDNAVNAVGLQQPCGPGCCPGTNLAVAPAAAAGAGAVLSPMNSPSAEAAAAAERAGADAEADVDADALPPEALVAVAAPGLVDDVDLAAASASHVSCSPEQAWCCGGLFGAVVDCEQQLQRYRHSCQPHHGPNHGLYPRPQQQHPQQQHDSDPDGEGVSSDTCCHGPAGSMRPSSSSSSLSSCVSRSSSCASDQSDAAAATAAAEATNGCCSGSDGRGGGPALRPHPSPRRPTCSPVSPQPQPLGNQRRSAPASRDGYSRSGRSSSGGRSRSSSGIADGGGGCSGSGSGRGGDGSGGSWDEGLHLPLWVSSNERAQIEKRLDGWVDALLWVGADVEGLAKVLQKPLRPLWISQSSTIWVDQVAQPDELPFTPLYLVSASQPQSYLRQAGGVGSGSDADGDSSDGGHGTALRQSDHQHQQPHSWTYVYVPGAGDDEESWAAGLTPAVFWAHYTRLLQAGPAGVHDTVRQLLRQEAATLAASGSNSTVLAAAATHGSVATAAAGFAAPTDQHHLLPAGCRGAATGGPAGSAASGAPGPGGLFFLGPTHIALGDMTAGTAPGCWQQVDAVLCCGAQRHPSMAGEVQWPLGGLAQAAEAAEDGSGNGSGYEPSPQSRPPLQQEQQQKPGEESDFTFRPPLRRSCSGGGAAGEGGATSDEAAKGPQHVHHHHHHQHHHHHRPHPEAPRYLHLPVEHFKHNRTSLLEHLRPALDFLSYHLSCGHKVLIYDANGLDTCVCIAVALLLACYGPCSDGKTSAPAWAQPYRSAEGAGVAVGHVSKDAVRQRLAYVSAWYPRARPTRGMLRQVFNHFVHAWSGSVGEGGAGEDAAEAG